MHCDKGTTLLEVMVVLAIIGVVGALIAPTLVADDPLPGREAVLNSAERLARRNASPANVLLDPTRGTYVVRSDASRDGSTGGMESTNDPATLLRISPYGLSVVIPPRDARSWVR